jgi:hypothetical protein
VVKVTGVTMERHSTLLACTDTATGERRQLRLDRIDEATLVEARGPRSE